MVRSILAVGRCGGGLDRFMGLYRVCGRKWTTVRVEVTLQSLCTLGVLHFSCLCTRRRMRTLHPPQGTAMLASSLDV